MHTRKDIERPFQLRCDAAGAGSFSAITDRLSVTVSQKILRDGEEQIWDTVVVHSAAQPDDTLRTRVLLCNPEWDEPLEIANVESRSLDPASRGIAAKLGPIHENL
jgi:hypothetical protein